MSRLAWLLMPLAVGRLRAGAQRVRRRAIYFAVAGFFALVAVVFALVAITTVLAAEFGVLLALIVMMVAAALIALIVMLALRIADRRARSSSSVLSNVPPRVYQSAMFSALSGARRVRAGRMVGAGLLVLAVALLAARGDEDD